jgi:hypothetical protein
MERRREPYTVYAVFDSDNTQRYTAYVDATDPSHAERLAERSANADIIIAGVVEGYVAPVDAVCRKDVTPLRGRGHIVWVSRLVVTSERFQIPRYCPRCRSDLQKINTLKQTNFPARIWDARLPSGLSDGKDWGALLNEDRGATIHGNPKYHVPAVRLMCANCDGMIWDGYRSEESPQAPSKNARRR